MKALNKRQQNLRTAGEIMNSCTCRAYSCSCNPQTADVHINTREVLYFGSYRAFNEAEPMSISNI